MPIAIVQTSSYNNIVKRYKTSVRIFKVSIKTTLSLISLFMFIHVYICCLHDAFFLYRLLTNNCKKNLGILKFKIAINRVTFIITKVN